jgi:glycosyltransferase involved in cell wall biosynthesis
VLLVARFQAVKNHGMLIDAFARLLRDVPAARLALAGSGPLEREARARCAARGLGGRVLFLGEVPFDDLPDVYAAADAKVIASDYESFCFAALEAMASGLPLAVTDTAWVPHLLGKDEAGRSGEGGIVECPGGMVMPVGDADGMAAALRRLAADRALRERMGRRNRERALAAHGWESGARALLEVYRRLGRAAGA